MLVRLAIGQTSMGRYMQAALQNVGMSKKKRKKKNYNGARSEKLPAQARSLDP